MGRWWSQDYLCSSETCGARFDLVIQHEDRERPVPCEVCGAQADPVMGAPATMQRALPDGTNRGVSWDRQKELARLKMARRNTRPEKRGDIDREMKKIEKAQLTDSKPDRFRT